MCFKFKTKKKKNAVKEEQILHKRETTLLLVFLFLCFLFFFFCFFLSEMRIMTEREQKLSQQMLCMLQGVSFLIYVSGR
jgi:hypothetical protein